MNSHRISFFLVMLLALLNARAQLTHYDRTDGLSSPIVGGGVQDDNGLMWFATWNGLHCYDGYEFYRVSIAPGDSATINTNLIRTIGKARNGNILCRTDDGIYEFDLREMKYRDLPAAESDSLARQLGRVWHGTAISQDDSEILWTGSTRGLYKEFNPHHPARLIEGTGKMDPRAVMADRADRLWVGGRVKPRLMLFEGNKAVDSINLDFTPYCIFERRNGEILIGGKPGGLVNSLGKKISGDVVYDMVEDDSGRLWIATWGDGLKDLDGDSTVTLVPGRKVRKLLLTRGGNIVAATSAGLLVVDPADMTVRTVTRRHADPSGLSSNATMSLAQDSKGYIYVATESSGVDRVAEESLMGERPLFEHYNVENSALDRDVVFGMALDNDTTLIITGPDRVMILNPETGTSVGYSSPFWGEDVIFAEGTPARLADGSWAFATNAGVLVATRHALYTRGYMPQLVVTGVSVNGGPERLQFLPSGHLDLDSRSRNVTLRFAAIDYIDNSHIRYRYCVDGSPWSGYSDSRTLTLFNLDAGTHEVELQSTDRYGRGIDNTLRLSLTVAPYWYETWWAVAGFYLLAAAAIAGGVWLCFYIRDVNRQRRELLEKYMALLDAPSSGAGEETPAPPVVESPEDAQFLRRVQDYIEANIGNSEANNDDMAEASAVSRATLNRRLRSLMGISAARLLVEARMKRASMLLANPDLSVADVAVACGYNDTYYFSRVYKNRFGKSPRE